MYLMQSSALTEVEFTHTVSERIWNGRRLGCIFLSSSYLWPNCQPASICRKGRAGFQLLQISKSEFSKLTGHAHLLHCPGIMEMLCKFNADSGQLISQMDTVSSIEKS